MHTLSAFEIVNKIKIGALSAVQVAEYFLERIKAENPKTGAFLRISTDKTLQKAQAIDAKIKSGKSCGSLAGVPIAIKDNIHIKNELSTCSSKFLTNYVAPFNAAVTNFLEEEDALLIGKTNMDEFAMGSSTANSALQMSYNPWDLSSSPGGSSGGSAAAVAARLTPLSLGSDTGGSIRQPASFCGVVGFKPTYGAVSRFGLVAFASSLDQIGPLATNVKDCALIMNSLIKPCQKDSTYFKQPSIDYLTFLKEDLAKTKIGVPWQFLEGLKEAAKDNFLLSLERLKQLGAEIVAIDLNILKYSIAVYYIIATAEASTNLARFDGIRYGVRSPLAKTLDEIYEFSKEEGFGPEVKRRILLGTYVLSAGYQDDYYKKAQKVRSLIIQKYQTAFTKCDLIAMPTTPSDAFKQNSIKTPLEMYLEDIYTLSINLAGLPAISIPNGLSPQRRPFGLQLIGQKYLDQEVMGAAYAFEKSYGPFPMPEELQGNI